MEADRRAVAEQPVVWTMGGKGVRATRLGPNTLFHTPPYVKRTSIPRMDRPEQKIERTCILQAGDRT